MKQNHNQSEANFFWLRTIGNWTSHWKQSVSDLQVKFLLLRWCKIDKKKKKSASNSYLQQHWTTISQFHKKYYPQCCFGFYTLGPQLPAI